MHFLAICEMIYTLCIFSMKQNPHHQANCTEMVNGAVMDIKRKASLFHESKF